MDQLYEYRPIDTPNEFIQFQLQNQKYFKNIKNSPFLRQYLKDLSNCCQVLNIQEGEIIKKSEIKSTFIIFIVEGFFFQMRKKGEKHRENKQDEEKINNFINQKCSQKDYFFKNADDEDNLFYVDKSLSKGQNFGESPKDYLKTFLAGQNSQIIILKIEQFNQIMKIEFEKQEYMRTKIQYFIPLLSEEETQQAIIKFTHIQFQPNQHIFTEKQIIDRIYFVQEGSVCLSKNGGEDAKNSKRIQIITENFVGHENIFQSKQYYYTCSASKQEVKAFYILKQDLDQIQTLKDELGRKGKLLHNMYIQIFKRLLEEERLQILQNLKIKRKEKKKSKTVVGQYCINDQKNLSPKFSKQQQKQFLISEREKQSIQKFLERREYSKHPNQSSMKQTNQFFSTRQQTAKFQRIYNQKRFSIQENKYIDQNYNNNKQGKLNNKSAFLGRIQNRDLNQASLVKQLISSAQNHKKDEKQCSKRFSPKSLLISQSINIIEQKLEKQNRIKRLLIQKMKQIGRQKIEENKKVKELQNEKKECQQCSLVNSLKHIIENNQDRIKKEDTKDSCEDEKKDHQNHVMMIQQRAYTRQLSRQQSQGGISSDINYQHKLKMKSNINKELDGWDTIFKPKKTSYIIFQELLGQLKQSKKQNFLNYDSQQIKSTKNSIQYQNINLSMPQRLSQQSSERTPMTPVNLNFQDSQYNKRFSNRQSGQQSATQLSNEC